MIDLTMPTQSNDTKMADPANRETLTNSYKNVTKKYVNAGIKWFISMASMIAMHPQIVETYGDTSTAPIRLATDLRNAIKHSVPSGIYPGGVLPTHRFTFALKLMGVTWASERGFHEMVAQENRGGQKIFHHNNLFLWKG